MSTIAERAAAEADEAEAEFPEPDPSEPEPEPPVAPDAEPEYEPPVASDPEPVSGLTAAEVEARFAKTEKANTAYSKKVLDILGELGKSLVPCPLCPDVHKGFLDMNDAGRVPEEIVAVVQEFMGVQREADYKHSPKHQRCPDCDGKGKWDTDSLVPNWKTLTCETCSGHGFVPPPGGASPVAVNVTTMTTDLPGEQFTAEKTDADPWGSPRLLDNGLENPNYGKMPQFKDPNLP